jgi:hypothetical protein
MIPHPRRWEEIAKLDRSRKGFYMLYKTGETCYAHWHPESQEFLLFDPHDLTNADPIPLRPGHPCCEPTHFRVWK